MRHKTGIWKRIATEGKATGNSRALRALCREMGVEALKQAPVVGTIFESGVKLIRLLADVEQEACQERIEQYIQGILKATRGEMDDDLTRMRNNMLAIMRKMLQDDDATKTRFYVRLTVSLAESELDHDTRLHFIRMVSALTHYQIRYAREFVLRTTKHLCGYVSQEEAELALTTRDDGQSLQALNTLISWGLLKTVRETPVAGPPPPSRFESTADMETLLRFMYDEDDMLPENIDCTAKTHVDVLITPDLCAMNHLYATFLPKLLEEKGLTVYVAGKAEEFRTTHTARRYIRLQASNDNDRKEFINIYILRLPDWKVPVGNPDRTVRVEKNLFYLDEKPFSPKPDPKKLRQVLTEVAGIVSVMIAQSV
ncbi:hypothetical protein [Kosakonia sp. MUSA4]|uniref:hypothetical protein n=1 Tax=Kosakonia sp. MUSA4 TaxID=2067958 RepID=UPI00159AC555|nr:hypothetical protein [Kosakonia sp. MUSA4]QJT82324.1 hypothetical protein C0557_20715 [Kosakonia sp. MUSA4]